MRQDTVLRSFVCLLLSAASSPAVDVDLDGVDDALDLCCGTPPGVAVDESGRPLGDLDLDCDMDLMDVALLQLSYTGPMGSQVPCQGGGDTENQCLMGTHNCHMNAYCTDTSSGFTCTCHPGYSGNGVQCHDINECAANACGPNGVCTNYIGGYSCNCPYGFVQAAGTCVDVNECADEGLCGEAGDCVNLPGSYVCDCNPGYANCDSKPDCEVALGNYSNTCETAAYLGTACGDSATGISCNGTSHSFYSNRTGRGSAWFRMHMAECSDCCAYLQHRYRLTVPAGVNYDLYVYSACNGTLEASSSQGTGMPEEVTPSFNDNCLSTQYDGRDMLIEIRHVSGSACENWVLQIENLE